MQTLKLLKNEQRAVIFLASNNSFFEKSLFLVEFIFRVWREFEKDVTFSGQPIPSGVLEGFLWYTIFLMKSLLLSCISFTALFSQLQSKPVQRNWRRFFNPFRK